MWRVEVGICGLLSLSHKVFGVDTLGITGSFARI